MKKFLLILTLLAIAGLAYAQSTHTATLGWTADPDAISGYNVYRSNKSGGPYTKITTTPVASTATSYVDPLTATGTYCYVITALANGVESGNSQEACAVLLPSAPTNLTVTIK